MALAEVYLDITVGTPDGDGTEFSPINFAQLYDDDDFYYVMGEGTRYKVRGVNTSSGNVSLEVAVHYTANADAQVLFEAWEGPWGFSNSGANVFIIVYSKRNANIISFRDFSVYAHSFTFTTDDYSGEGGKYYVRNAYIESGFTDLSSFSGLCDVDYIGCTFKPLDEESQMMFDFFNEAAYVRFYYCYFAEYYHNTSPGYPPFNAFQRIRNNFTLFYDCYFENAEADELGFYYDGTLFTLAADEVIDSVKSHAPASPVPSSQNLSIATRSNYTFSLFSLPVISDPGTLADFVSKEIDIGLFGDARIAIGAFEMTTATPVAADFSADTYTGKTPLPVVFTDLSTGSPTTWLWDFGDGSTSSDQNPAHVYTTYGSLRVTLTVSDGVSSSSTFKYITIYQSSDIGAFMYIDSTSPINDFYVQSSGDDYWNAGGKNDPFRTLDKAMIAADSTIHIDGGHYDTFYLKLKEHTVELNQLYVYTTLPDHLVSYLTLNQTDIDNGYVALPTFVKPSDATHVAINVIGGPAQVYGSDYSVQYGSLLWKDMVLEDYLAAGDTIRILFGGPLQYKALNTIVLHSHFPNYEQEKAIFVSPSGSDSTIMGGDGTNSGGNGTVELPYRTITRALSQSSPGDNIVVFAGEYPIFNGLDDRILVPAIDRTSVPDKDERRVYEDSFNPEDFRSFGHTLYDVTPWTLSYAGDSTASYGGGYLNFTYDGTNTASAIATFDITSDYKISSYLRNSLDPIRFQATSPDSTLYFSYNDSSYSAGIITNGIDYVCSGVLEGWEETHVDRYITEYRLITSDDVRNKYISLSYIPETSDCSNIALNIVGGVPQNYGEDFYMRDSKLKWDGMALDGDVEPGDVFRIHYLDRSLSDPVQVFMSLTGKRALIKIFNGTWRTVNKRDIVEDYTGPWKVAYVMDGATPGISHDCIYGKGFAYKFSAIADSFINMTLDKRYDAKTERRNLVFYDED